MPEAPHVPKESPINPLARNFDMVSLLRFAFPTVGMMIFVGLYTIVDTIFISRFAGTEALSSLNIVTPIINVIVGIAAMLGAGGSAMVAGKMGGGKNKEARENFTLIISTVVLLGLSIFFLGTLWMIPLIRGLGASDLLFPYCREYLSVLFFFAPVNMLQVAFATFFVTAGRPGLGMGLCVLGGFANALFDYVFIVSMHMGIRGAALATGVGQMIPAVIGIVFFLCHRTEALYFSRFRFHARVLMKSCVNGSSEMVGQLSAAVTTYLFNMAMMRLLGEEGVAAITIIIYSQFLLTTLYIGFSAGVAPVISYNHGSQDHERLKKVVRICLGFLLIASTGIFLFSILGSSFLAFVFSPKNARVYEFAKGGFRLFSFSFLFCGINIFTSAMFTALSNGKISALLSFLRTFVFIVLGILLLPLLLRVKGVWLAVPVAELLSLAFSLYFVAHYKNEYHYL